MTTYNVAFEFLQRIRTPNVYDPWTANKRLSTSRTIGSQEACAKWKADNNYPLNNIREYRNHLTHGRMPPAVFDPSTNKLYLPRIGFELKFLDWRIITSPMQLTSVPIEFDSVENILNKAWLETLVYFENEWQSILGVSP